MNDIRFNKILILVNALVPLSLLALDAWRGSLGANPIEYFLRATGILTLVFLLLTLSVTPLRRTLRRNDLIKYRRMVGLIAFAYSFLHLTTYAVFDRSFDTSGIVTDVLQRPFIAVGMTAFLLMVPLALTSTGGMIKRVGGRNWARLHRLVYLIAILGVIHFWMIVKSDVFYPAIFAGCLLVLFAARIWPRGNTVGSGRTAREI
ncbi:sulfite oxidase heme-binding subunit YedZ [Leptolyngbya sp. 7M]|uniref:sulfite oxidase heme-binding subunit YedZ n=1 Tax=Leptolyngbya sp. 7M TaxID=2812896 RepID=UPI001B8D014B|nr:protein-methionine-sulfoxide reductase heme-binding subunit MsrQ [Leptolyngbya sp. 7M]QYO65652.1 sulfoxide reductase heme-binding subunit YedZ [Leptolyngbya sp. 7M]